MTYKLNKLDDPESCIERQAETIYKLREDSRKKTEALIKASKRIAKLEAEKADLTNALNRVSRPVGRTDQNWDSRPREESWEL